MEMCRQDNSKQIGMHRLIKCKVNTRRLLLTFVVFDFYIHSRILKQLALIFPFCLDCFKILG